jgi:hypothetical protein
VNTDHHGGQSICCRAGLPTNNLSVSHLFATTALELFKSARMNTTAELYPLATSTISPRANFPNDATLEPVTCGALSGVGVDYVADGNFWLKRWLHKGPLLVYATYNCDAADRASELPDVNRMLATLKSAGAPNKSLDASGGGRGSHRDWSGMLD